MISVLQIRGNSLENGIARHMAAASYRKEMLADGQELLFFEVADISDRLEFSKEIGRFVDENRDGLVYALQNPHEVSQINLDIGIVMGSALSSTLELEKSLVATLGQLGISISVAAYRSGSQE